MKINNGSIQEYFKEEGISDIQTSISICNDSQDLSDLEIQIPKMEACVEGKDFKLAMYLKNPIYDPFVHGFVKGEINLKSLQKYLPLFSNNELNGVVNTDIFIKGKMSDVDNNNYKNVLMDGSIKMKNFQMFDVKIADTESPNPSKQFQSNVPLHRLLKESLLRNQIVT